jgi:homoserine kinase
MHVSRTDAIFNIQRTGLFLTSLQTGRFELLREAMKDRLHQPMRQALIPGLSEILSIPTRDGFYGVALSGAGPSILALVDSRDSRFEREVGNSIAEIFRSYGIQSAAMALEIDNEGCTVEGSL